MASEQVFWRREEKSIRASNVFYIFRGYKTQALGELDVNMLHDMQDIWKWKLKIFSVSGQPGY